MPFGQLLVQLPFHRNNEVQRKQTLEFRHVEQLAEQLRQTPFDGKYCTLQFCRHSLFYRSSGSRHEVHFVKVVQLAQAGEHSLHSKRSWMFGAG